jgi:hypothetical protein
MIKPIKMKLWDQYGNPLVKFRGSIKRGKSILEELEEKYG